MIKCAALCCSFLPFLFFINITSVFVIFSEEILIKSDMNTQLSSEYITLNSYHICIQEKVAQVKAFIVCVGQRCKAIFHGQIKGTSFTSECFI